MEQKTVILFRTLRQLFGGRGGGRGGESGGGRSGTKDERSVFGGPKR